MSTQFGYDRGTPIDRWYIERFLADHADLVRGQVLEVQSDDYAIRFGGSVVTGTEVMFSTVGEAPDGVTLRTDITQPDALPSDAFDCIIFTQVLQFLPRLDHVVANLHAALRPGGSLLVSTPGISSTIREDEVVWGEYWRLLPAALQGLLTEHFSPGDVAVHGVGNAKTATAALYGLAAEDLRPRDLEIRHDDYDVLSLGVATKPATAPAQEPPNLTDR